jgi:ABC-type transport system involved in cytochrome bd biosynthesis fused ATPase/permease subunit
MVVSPEHALVSGVLLVVGAGWFLGEAAFGGPLGSLAVAISLVVPGVALAAWGMFRARSRAA